MTNQSLHLAFLNTSYKVLSKPEFNIKINTHIPEAEHLQSWVFLTAWNPLPEVLSLDENTKRNQNLINDIINFDLKYCHGIGIAEDENWAEESYFIENITKEKALELAVKYG